MSAKLEAWVRSPACQWEQEQEQEGNKHAGWWGGPGNKTKNEL